MKFNNKMKILFFMVSIFALNTVGFNLINEVLKKVDKKCKIITDNTCPRAAETEISYWLYTRSHKDDPVKLEVSSLGKAPFVKGPLKIMVPGYTDNHTSPIVLEVKKAYLSHDEYNVVAVDWYNYTKKSCYYQSVQSIPTVGHCVAQFLNSLVKAHKFPGVHMMGHSLGAHVAAWTSLDMDPILERLTKFDPAMPLFTSKNSRRGKATFIDVYHSNCAIAGQRQISGDLDVYFNTDTFQPGCKCDIACSHSRCVTYFLESIAGHNMTAFPCPGWTHYLSKKCPVPSKNDLILVGEDVDKKEHGVYMVFTGDKPPYLKNSTVYTTKDLFYSFKKLLREEECAVTKYASLVKDWIMG